MKKYIVPTSFAYKLPFFLFFTIFLTALPTNAQVVKLRRKENSDVHGFATKTFDLPKPEKKIRLSNFSNLIVLDERTDTGRIGLLKKGRGKYFFKDEYSRKVLDESSINDRPVFMVMKEGLQNKLEQYARQGFEFSTSDTGTEILMLVKKLWIADEACGDWVKNNPYKSYDSSLEKYPNIYLSIGIEFYMKKNNGYFALYKYDTVIAIKGRIYAVADEVISTGLNNAMARLTEMDEKVDMIIKKRRFSLDDILAHAQEPYRVAIMSDSALRAGVYMSFDEFKNNSPSEKHYRLKKEKLSDNIYVALPGGEEQIVKNAWGYCDGKYIYIRSANNFYVLQRLGNAFYVFGSNELVKTADHYSHAALGGPSIGGTVNGSSVQSGQFVPVLKAFYLDWETGVLY